MCKPIRIRMSVAKPFPGMSVVEEKTLGLIFHWGLYSVPGFLKPSNREGNGSEWYLKRLLEKSEFRPIGGHKETKLFHQTHYGNKEYVDFQLDFLSEGEDYVTKRIQEWMKLAKETGVSYVILTAKHHDGFCLWNTNTTSFKSKFDVLNIFKIEAQKQGLQFGLYYSWCEFTSKMTKKYIKEIMIPQVKELQTYCPTYWWADGHWEIKTKFAKETISQLVSELIENQIQINDRIVCNNGPSPSFYNFSDRYLPDTQPLVPWESIQTLGTSWGIVKNYQQTYKTTEQIQEIAKNVWDKKGRLLINLGPDENGNLVSKEVELLRCITMREKK